MTTARQIMRTMIDTMRQNPASVTDFLLMERDNLTQAQAQEAAQRFIEVLEIGLSDEERAGRMAIYCNVSGIDSTGAENQPEGGIDPSGTSTPRPSDNRA